MSFFSNYCKRLTNYLCGSDDMRYSTCAYTHTFTNSLFQLQSKEACQTNMKIH